MQDEDRQQEGRPGDGKRRVQSIEVGFRVIRVLQRAEAPMALRDIARDADMPPSKAHLYLTSFLREGLVHQHPRSGHYALGDYALELGLSAIRQLSLVDVARDEMEALTAETGCPTYLSLYTPGGPAIVSKVDGRRQGAFAVRLGYVLPMTSSATGMVYIAYLAERETRDLVLAELAAQNESDVDARYAELRTRAEAAKGRGHAATAGLVNANFAGIAAPIFDYAGGIAAVMTLLGPDKYLVGDRMAEGVELLTGVTGRISAKLGGIGRPA